MNFFIYTILHLCLWNIVIARLYNVVGIPSNDSPLIDNGELPYTASPTIFMFNKTTLGIIVESKINGNHVFVVSTVIINSNGSLIVEPLKEKNILPLNTNLENVQCDIRYPSVSYSDRPRLLHHNIYSSNATYFLVYNEKNKDSSEPVFALASTLTPFIPDSWKKLGDIAVDDVTVIIGSASIFWSTEYNLNNHLIFSLTPNITGNAAIINPLGFADGICPLLLPRKGYFDDFGAHPGSSPLLLKNGEFLMLYNGENSSFSTAIGYAILGEEFSSEISQITQRCDKPIMSSTLQQMGISAYSLIPDPFGCPSNAVGEIGPDFASDVECFIGVYSNGINYTGFFRVFAGWNDSMPLPTTPDATTTTITEASIPITLSTEIPIFTTNESSTSTTSTSSVTSTLSTENTTPLLTSTLITETSTTSSAPISKSALIIIILSSVTVILIILAVSVYCFKRNKNRSSLIDLIIKQHEMPAEDAKALAETVDKFQLNSKQISTNYQKKIGSGSTATVYEGFFTGDSAFTNSFNKFGLDQKFRNCKVAVKIPKEISRTETEQIMRELQAMQQIGYHAHIAVLLGWCFQNDLVSLVFEIAQQDLFTYICSFRKFPSTCLPLKQLFSIAWQVSVGMEHVASFNMVHRDLAARNVLLYEGFHAKISDFGLCCRCDESFTYQATLDKKLPLRWLSIEALMDRTFSEKSDVWAFGVLLFEMCTNGAVPYTVMSNNEILEFLQSGQRLEKPETANEELYDLMLNCWKESLEERFTFADVTKSLQRYLEAETQTYGYLSVASEEPEIIDSSKF